MANRVLKVGTRASLLAVAQTRMVMAAITQQHPTVTLELIKVSTAGDHNHGSSLKQIGGQGVFTKALEQELRDGLIDVAVHSAKDLPAVMADDLIIAAVPKRESPADVWISSTGAKVANIDEDAIVGTGSPRRRAQLLNLRPTLQTADIRGNIETRVEKMRSGQYDALIMAAAGLRRADVDVRITEVFDPAVFLPAPGQGALAVQCRHSDDEARSILREIDHHGSHRCLDIERALLAELKAGCSTPIGGLATISENDMTLRAVVLDESGKTALRADHSINIDHSNDELVAAVVDQLRELGAFEVIRAYHESQ